MTAETFPPAPPVVYLLSDRQAYSAVPGLARLLIACLEDGAGIGFVLPLSVEDAEAFWRAKCEELTSGQSFMMVARQGADIAGVVMLCLAPQQNGSHRADVAKLMVHPDHRRKGLARKLMAAVDDLARAQTRWLLVLDTVTGDSAESLYPTCGYQKAGIIPDYAYGSHGQLDATTIFYKDLR
ncbi:GNAT family N-acetyltransferase [Roseibium denhamense]|uniref:Ribosomal protein S18 acetylase RimI n=1 Tax=Roseibium denhamense TaxID=76305 RepID=A0ABY1P5S4_9HYPH|nr:GNAT family N-acetyltransferase [Roseibium denhamense]MTI07119.1 GNAT family N-acetyltransferase [Roseibium denhamense]SMP26979.1 Ribosomal protein S18 acetylase RimI [Roseibium denhamense]